MTYFSSGFKWKVLRQYYKDDDYKNENDMHVQKSSVDSLQVIFYLEFVL